MMQEDIIKYLILFISIFGRILYWAIFISILMSWVSRKRTPFKAWLDSLVNPILRPFRWARMGMLDFSPIVALIAIQFLQKWVIELLSKQLG